MSQSAFIHIASVMRSVTTCNIPSDSFLQLTRGDFLPESWLQQWQPKWLLLCCRQFDSWILKGSLQKSKCHCSLNYIQFFGNSINIILKKSYFQINIFYQDINFFGNFYYISLKSMQYSLHISKIIVCYFTEVAKSCWNVRRISAVPCRPSCSCSSPLAWPCWRGPSPAGWRSVSSRLHSTLRNTSSDAEILKRGEFLTLFHLLLISIADLKSFRVERIHFMFQYEINSFHSGTTLGQDWTQNSQ